MKNLVLNIVAIIAAAVIVGLQGWTLNEVVNLKVSVARLESRLDSSHPATLTQK